MSVDGLSAPEAALIAATVAGVLNLLALWQKWGNDRRSAWWLQARWAIDRTFDKVGDDPALLSTEELDKLEIAQAALAALQQQSGLQPGDYDVVAVAIQRVERLMIGDDLGTGTEGDLDSYSVPGDDET